LAAPVAPAPAEPPPAPAPSQLLTELPPLPAPPPAAVARVEPKREPADALVRLGEDGGSLRLLQQIRFNQGKASLDPRSFALLRAVARALQAHPEVTLVEVQGHTDNREAGASRQRLSQQRAEAAVRFLTGQGVAAERLRAKGYGSDHPRAPNVNKRNRDRNRRVEFRVLEHAKAGPQRAG
jgi:outer membrane protein OmpA-like peptidoglycan-associated protein